MKLSETAIRYGQCQAYLNMLKGLEMMILKAPNNEKKEMLNDIIKFGKELTESHLVHLNSIQWLQAENTKFEGLYYGEKIDNKKLRIEKGKLESQIKEMLK